MTLKFITILLSCQLAGEMLAQAARLPVPGPVIGMVLLFAGLAIKGRVPQGLAITTTFLLDHLALLFVPAGVGIISLLPLLSNEYPAIIAALIGSTLLAIIVTAAVMNVLLRWTRKDHAG